MLVKTALERHGGAGHGVLQAKDRTVVALTGCWLAGLLAMVLNQVLQFAAASIQCAGKIQRDIGGVVVMGLTELVRPVTKQLPLISSLFWDWNRIFVHIYSTNLRTRMLVTCFMHPLWHIDAPHHLSVDTPLKITPILDVGHVVSG